MRHVVTDTSVEAERELIELVRRAPVWKRVALAASLCDATRALALADLRHGHPASSERHLRHLLAVGEPTAARLLTVHNLTWLRSLVLSIREAVAR